MNESINSWPRATEKRLLLTSNWRKRRFPLSARYCHLIRRGEVYWCNFGERRGREQSGARPALVIQNDRGNESSDTTIVATLTSRMFTRSYPMHVEVDGDETGLSGRSTVLLEQILTVDVGRLGRRTGMLGPLAMERVDEALRYSLGLIL